MEGNGTLTGVRLRDVRGGDTRALDCTAVFVFIGARPRTDWLPPSVAVDTKGVILTGANVTRWSGSLAARGAARTRARRDDLPWRLRGGGRPEQHRQNALAFAVGDGALAVSSARIASSGNSDCGQWAPSPAPLPASIPGDRRPASATACRPASAAAPSALFRGDPWRNRPGAGRIPVAIPDHQPQARAGMMAPRRRFQCACRSDSARKIRGDLWFRVSCDREFQYQALIERAGAPARYAWEEFFEGELANAHTRKNYEHAVKRFLAWCDAQGLDLLDLTPGGIEVGISGSCQSPSRRKCSTWRPCGGSSTAWSTATSASSTRPRPCAGRPLFRSRRQDARDPEKAGQRSAARVNRNLLSGRRRNQDGTRGAARPPCPSWPS